MFLNSFTGDSKAEAGTGRFGREVWIKDPGQDLRRDARAVVLDRNDYFGVDSMAAEAHDAARGGLEGVLDQVRYRPSQHPWIARELCRRRRRDLGAEIDSALAAVGVAGGDLLQQPAQIQRLFLHLPQRRVVAE